MTMKKVAEPATEVFDDALLAIGDNIDRLVSIEARSRGYDQGVIRKLYDSAYRVFNRSLTLTAAGRLIAQVSPGDIVFIATGAGITPYLPKGETDGPLGAAALARAIRHGLNGVPILLTDDRMVENLAATCTAAGLSVHDVETIKRVPSSCAVVGFPSGDDSEEAADSLLDLHSPAALIAIERLAPNRVGIAHSAMGLPVGDDRARLEHLFNRARGREMLTIGIGDNGNEIGFGTIEADVRTLKQWGNVCRCPCNDGLASAVKTDVLVVAGVSNWGAYGVEACLATLLGQPDLIHDKDTELHMLRECVRTGALDGATITPSMTVDGTGREAQTGLLELLRAIVGNGLRVVPERPF